MTLLCWACGVPCCDRTELKDHLATTHTQNVDYIVCPECGDVLVDLFLHWQVRHTNTPLPAGVYLRPEKTPVDYRQAYLKQQAKASRRVYKKGAFESEKNGCKVPFRSSWERTAYQILEKAFSVRTYHAEPFAIQYIWHGSSHRYFPDIKVVFIDSSIGLIEVKPLSQCPDPDGQVDNDVQGKNEAKWQAAAALCRAKNWTWIIWTERALRELSAMKGEMLAKSVLMD